MLFFSSSPPVTLTSISYSLLYDQWSDPSGLLALIDFFENMGCVVVAVVYRCGIY